MLEQLNLTRKGIMFASPVVTRCVACDLAIAVGDLIVRTSDKTGFTYYVCPGCAESVSQ